jgi:hypothetical protein
LRTGFTLPQSNRGISEPKLEIDLVLLSEQLFLSFGEKLLVEAGHPCDPVQLVLVFFPIRFEFWRSSIVVFIRLARQFLTV